MKRSAQPVIACAHRRCEALQAGDAEHLKRLTGRFFDLEGVVVRGQGRGRSLGFPTANLALDARQMTPGDGVYAVRVVTPSGLVDGVMNVGRAPTLRGDEGARVLEVTSSITKPSYTASVCVWSCVRGFGVSAALRGLRRLPRRMHGTSRRRARRCSR